MNTTKLESRKSDINISKDRKENTEQLRRLVLPKVATQTFPTSSTKTSAVSAEVALSQARTKIEQGSMFSRCELVEELHGTGKQWQINFSRPAYCNHDGNIFLSCHRLRDFTTYSIHVDGQEFWFDNYDKAFASLFERKDAPFHLIDMITKEKY